MNRQEMIAAAHQCLPRHSPDGRRADQYIYVADMVNLRLLRIRKTFQVEAASR